MRWIICFAILACAVPAHAALIRFEMAGDNASGFGDPGPGLNGRGDMYIIDVICQDDLSSCELTFDVPGAPPQVSLPSVEVVLNDIMHQTGILGFTSSDFRTQMRLIGDPAILPVLDVNNFNQGVEEIDWRYYDDQVWPNFTGYYGGLTTNISTPLIIPEPNLAGILWLPAVLGFGFLRSRYRSHQISRQHL